VDFTFLQFVYNDAGLVNCPKWYANIVLLRISVCSGGLPTISIIIKSCVTLTLTVLE